jgi:hypothetical protein
MIGGLVTQFSGGSHEPEKSPGPPHASPSTLAHTLQHLKWDRKQNENFIKLIEIRNPVSKSQILTTQLK